MAEKNVYKLLALASAFTFTSASAVIIYFGIKMYYEKKEMQTQLKKYKKMQTLKYLLIGLPGVGKTKLFKRISNFLKQTQINQGFEEFELRHDIDLVCTPAIDFENINQREIIINQFSQYMMKNHIIHFFLLVNFERTDLMKKKIVDVIKFFKKFKEKITIIVTDFQLSDNQEQDKQNLKQAFHLYLNKYQSIMFVENNFNVEEFKNQLLIEAQALNLNDTIFEPINENEYNQIMQQFQNRFNNGNFNQIQQQQKNEDDNEQKQQEKIIKNIQQDNIQQKQNKQHQQQEYDQFKINDQQLFKDDHSILMNGQFKSDQNQQ